MLLAAKHPEQAAPLVLHSTTFPVELFLNGEVDHGRLLKVVGAS